MSDKIYITQDDSEIVDYLTDAGIKLDDGSSRVLTFALHNHYHLILYFSTSEDKGFVMFRIDNIEDNIKEISNLKKILQELLRTGDNVNVLKSAIAQVEQVESAGLAAEIFKSKKLPN